MKKDYGNKIINIKYDKKKFNPGDMHILYDNIKEGEKCNLYLVSTPSQLLSAIEAQQHFETKSNILVILFFVVGDGKNINHMFELTKYFPYDKLLTYQNKSAQYYISFIPFLKSLKKSTYNYIFFGFNTILYRRMIANLSYLNLFYLDDGVHTITTHENFFGNEKSRPEYIPFPKTLNLLKMIYIYGKHGLKVDSQLKDLNFFTVYNLKQYKNEKIIIHNFSHLRSLFYIKESKSSAVYVLGQPLVNIGVEQKEYNNYLKKVFQDYEICSIIFVPHRLEKIDHDIEYYINNHANISILIPSMPIELYFLKKGIYPKEVISFITSALFNIKYLYPNTNTKAYKINITNLDQFHRVGIERIYTYYKNENITIIPLEDGLIC